MEEKNTNTETEVKDNVGSKDKKETSTNSATKDTISEPVTMSKSDYDKAIHDAEDKVRDEYSKQIKDLETKVKELTPVEKSETEIAMEKRIAALEESEKAVAERERKIAVQEKLAAGGLDKTLADYIKDDVDIDALSILVDGIVKSRMKFSGYVPSDHSSDDKVTSEEFAKWTYSKKAEFAQKHPESYARLRSKK
jgi:hypothetical protein